ncbi:MAG: phosphoribosylanthranilate isomerase [Flavobacteriaceae bacterium]|nr:phosphoribosylanthranilate isomerase [Bacteroidia bacterium]MBT8289083.1 phosphoribosylanthranilate isomerase [Bacteroidia bacterium]NNF74972.1 phosphoribosylanthranilate isomerase [Flavobacteriaceae bacterium]NNK86980.1 phosphoribosylanthranilate isomerase [Flavobacteriaceae bacterium]
MKLKVCGMKYADNIRDIASLEPDYMGFIFYKGSSRNMTADIPEIGQSIKKVGVFVNETISEVTELCKRFHLDAIQLHGDESPDYCEKLKHELQKLTLSKHISVIKAFSVDETFDFKRIGHYTSCCDFYLFDTKGELPGGNGIAFDWNLLADYKGDKPFFLSGGIGLEALDALHEFKQAKVSKFCHAIDVNSKFEDEPGLKNKNKLIDFKTKL